MKNLFLNAIRGGRATRMPGGQKSYVTMLSIALLIITLWLTTRPYKGVVGDSIFYTVQALNALMPGRFAEDLYFRYGSQDQFTLFSLVYKPFIAAFGIASGNLILTVLGGCLWVTGIFYLAQSMFRDTNMALLAVTAAILLPGNLGSIYYAEPFLTPRIFAETLTAYAMGSMLRGRPMRALVLLCLSITIHPLMTLPGLAVLFFYEATRRPFLWLAGALAVIAALALAIGGMQPFSRLFVSFDPAWLAIVELRDFFCFMTNWQIGAWLPVCNTFALAALEVSLASRVERRFLGSVLGVAVGGFALCLFGGDFLHNVLIVDIQTWRTAWLLAVVAHLLIGPMLLRVRKRGAPFAASSVVLLAPALALLALSGLIPMLSVVAAPICILAWLVVAWEHRQQREIPVPARLLVCLFLGLICAVAIVFVDLEMRKLAATPIGPWPTILGIALAAVSLAALGMILILPAKAPGAAAHPLPMLFLSIILVILAGLNWDQRTPWTKFVDATAAPPADLAALLPGDSPIYWEGAVTIPWFLLKRASYFSCDQGTGVLFSRGTAINYQRRYESFEPLQTLDFGSAPICPLTEDHAPARRNRAALSALCKREPELGALVLIKRAEDDPGEVWVSPIKFENDGLADSEGKMVKTDRFYVYACADLR